MCPPQVSFAKLNHIQVVILPWKWGDFAGGEKHHVLMVKVCRKKR
jgi:hypothetical protein